MVTLCPSNNAEFFVKIFGAYYVDLNLEKADKTSSGYTLNIKNIGGFAAPFDVNVTYADGSTDTFHQTPKVWEKDQKETAVKVKTSKAVKTITLDGGIFIDADMTNNTWTAQ